MDNRVSPLRVILLALLTVLVLAILAGAGLYLRDSMLMREADINYNAGEYSSALARYKVLQDALLFKQEAFQKADYCNYNLAREAMENEQWEEAKGYLNEVKSFELDSVNKLLKECDDGLEAEADRLRSYDKIFLEDLERAITLRLDPDDDGDVVVREQMFLKDYDHRYFQDQKLRDYALRYLDALQQQYDARSEIYKSERDLAVHDAKLLNYEVLDGLYRDYQFMADNVQFVGEFVGELPRMREYNASLHEVYADMHGQIDRRTRSNGEDSVDRLVARQRVVRINRAVRCEERSNHCHARKRGKNTMLFHLFPLPEVWRLTLTLYQLPTSPASRTSKPDAIGERFCVALDLQQVAGLAPYRHRGALLRIDRVHARHHVARRTERC